MTKLRAIAFLALTALFLFALTFLGGRDSTSELPSKTKPTTPKPPSAKPRPQTPQTLTRRILLSGPALGPARKTVVEGSGPERTVAAATMIAAELELGRALVATCAKHEVPIPRFQAEMVREHQGLRADVLAVLPDFEKRDPTQAPYAPIAARRLLKGISGDDSEDPIGSACRKLESEPAESVADLLPPDLFPRAHRILTNEQ